MANRIDNSIHSADKECAQICVEYIVKKCLSNFYDKQSKTIILKEYKSCIREWTKCQGDQKHENAVSLPKYIVECVLFLIKIFTCKVYSE